MPVALQREKSIGFVLPHRVEEKDVVYQFGLGRVRILAGVTLLPAENQVSQRSQRPAGVRRTLAGREGNEIFQIEQIRPILETFTHNASEHRRNTGVLDRVLPAIEVEADIAGVDGAARGKDTGLGRFSFVED